MELGGEARGYEFLTLFFIMASANIALIHYTLAYNRQMNGKNDLFRRELCTQTAILIAFELSFLLRFAWDVFLFYSLFDLSSMFDFLLAFDVVSYVAGFSYLALLLFHRKNFAVRKKGRGKNGCIL